MTVEITLQLPEYLVEQAKRLGSVTHREAGVVIADALEMLWLMVGESPVSEGSPPTVELANDEILELADSKMDAVQNQRMGDLQAKGKAARLTDAERYELLALLQIYQLGQLRKSEAMAESVRRGLRQPLSA